MKKKLISVAVAVIAAAATLCALPACTKQIDYTNYVSESRSNIYIYKDDETEIKLQCVKREQPFAADGFKGELCELIEIFVTLPKNPQEVEISVNGLGGEMNYQAVTRQYTISFSSSAFAGDELSANLTLDGKEQTYTLLSVKHDGILSCENAVLCVVEYAKELFDGLTANGIFDGEIFVRLLHDDGCYYYVGVCDKTKKISAFLIDGERGKVIAKKQIQA